MSLRRNGAVQNARLAKVLEVNKLKLSPMGTTPIIHIISCDRDSSGNESTENIKVQPAAALSWQVRKCCLPSPK